MRLKKAEDFIQKKHFFILYIILALSFFLYSFVGIQKHQHFQTFAWDTSFFVQQLYFVDKLQPPYTSLSNMNGLGDHFHILFLASGFLAYKVWADPRILFVLQALFVCSSGIPLYLLSKNLLDKSKLPKIGIAILSLILVLMYLFSVSMQGLLVDEFHNDALATLPLLWLMYFLYRKNNLGYWVAFGLLLLAKETYGLFAFFLGIYIAIGYRDFKKAIATAFIGLFCFYVLTYQVMPKISGSNTYFHFNEGNEPRIIIQNLIKNPATGFTSLFDSSEKIQTIFVAFLSFGFLPLFAPTQLIMPIFSLLIRFLDSSTQLLDTFNNHYSSPLMPFMAVAASFGLAKFFQVCRRFNLKVSWQVVGIFLMTVLIYQNFIYHGSLNSLFKKSFYQTSQWEYDAYELIMRVPITLPVASQNSLLPHLSQRNKFYLLPQVGDARFIAVDLSDGPNKFSPINKMQTAQLIQSLVDKGEYKIIWEKNKAILLGKTSF